MGIKITLPKPILIVDSMEQKPYTFKPFRKWFAAIGRRKLPAGDYSIAGMEDKLAVVAIVIAKGWSKREFMERISFLVCYRMDVGWRVSAMSQAVYLAAHNIRVNCICPGSIDSPMSRVFIDRSGTLKGEALENALRENAKKAPMNRMAKPEEIANLALFLASDESSFITGASVPIDGGKIAKV